MSAFDDVGMEDDGSEEEEGEEQSERTWRALKVDAIGIKRERCNLR